MPRTLADALERLHGLQNWERAKRSQMRVDLAPVRDLLQRLGSPHLRVRGVHVTGTKGKGSVSSLVEAGLRAAGLRTGLYISPHIEALNERIQIAGAPIDDDALALDLWATLDAREQAVAQSSAASQASWFDVLTACAFRAFCRAGVDWAVVEVGLGGRLDSTNAWNGDVAVLTNVGLEHTDVLGDTIEAIAREKVAIAKPGSVLVTTLAAESPAGRVVSEWTTAHRVAVHVVPPTAECDSVSHINRALASEVLDVLGQLGVRSAVRGRAVSRRDLTPEVAAGAALPGRMESFRVPSPGGRADRLVVLDGAHVDFALAAVLRELRARLECGPPPVVLMALGADKPAAAILDVLRGAVRSVVFVPLEAGRPCHDPSALVALARERGVAAECAPDAAAGLAQCMRLASGGWVLVTGSLYLVAQLRPVLKGPGPAPEPGAAPADDPPPGRRTNGGLPRPVSINPP